MNRRLLIILVVAMAAGAAAGGYWLISGGGRSPAEMNPRAVKTTDEPAVSVEVTPARIGAVTEDAIVYGTVVPAPGAVQVISVPFESRVHHVMVSGGQRVSSRDVLLEIEPSPDTYLKLEEARNSYRLAEEGLKQMRRRFDLKLATNDQLLQSRQAFEEARLRIESMTKRGIDGPREIKADTSGFISKVNVQEGAIVPAGDSLVEIVAGNRLEAILGVEPEDIKHVRARVVVSLFHVNAASALESDGRIRKISSAVNPATRLVDVFVTLPPSSDFLLGEYVKGRITLARAEGVVVPRSAVLPEDSGYVIFTVMDGRAVRHVVETGLENGKDVEVIGQGIKPGDSVVVLGNYELRDGMAVKAAGAK